MTAGTSRTGQIVASLFLALHAMPASAEHFADRFSEMGRIEATVDGVDIAFDILWDANRKRGAASIRERLGILMINMSGATISSEGHPGLPQLSLSFVIDRNGEANTATMDFVDGWSNVRMPFVVDLENGSLTISSFEMLEDDSITVTFQGELVHLDRTDPSNYAVVPGPMVTISGTAHARLSEPQ